MGRDALTVISLYFLNLYQLRFDSRKTMNFRVSINSTARFKILNAP